MSYAQLSQRVISFDQLAKIKVRYVQPAQIQVDQVGAWIVHVGAWFEIEY